ncbi:hypothetical protein [Paenibacillus sp. y28]|uniref:hypothetical protein n=1 Tax=Paenibacillus sp. y28 TaxID=3129110 RepID=UPI00301B2AE7
MIADYSVVGTAFLAFMDSRLEWSTDRRHAAKHNDASVTGTGTTAGVWISHNKRPTGR